MKNRIRKSSSPTGMKRLIQLLAGRVGCEGWFGAIQKLRLAQFSRWPRKLRPKNEYLRMESAAGSSRIPMLRREATASGSKPSPHVLSMGGLRESMTVTRRPLQTGCNCCGKPSRARSHNHNVGSHDPLAPPPSTIAKGPIPQQKPGPMAARILSVPGSGRRCE